MANTAKREWKQSDFRLNRKGKPFLVSEDKSGYQPTEVKRKEEIDKPKKTDFEIIRREQMDVTYAVLKFKKLNDDAELPMKPTFGSAGYDVIACTDGIITIQPGETMMIPTGLMASFRKEFVGLLYSKDTMATKYGLVIAQGVAVIDSDCRTEWKAPIKNISDKPQLIRSGDRIAQLLVQPVCRVKMFEVDDLNRAHYNRYNGGENEDE